MTNNHNWSGIRADVAGYCQNHNIQNDDFRFLNLYEWQSIYDKVLEIFIDDQYARYNGLHWANVENGFKKEKAMTFCFTEGMNENLTYEWIKKLPQIVNCAKIYLILEESSNKFWIAECRPEVVHQIINEALYPLDYYIVDKKFTWLITRNHHDVVQFIGDSFDVNIIKSVL